MKIDLPKVLIPIMIKIHNFKQHNVYNLYVEDTELFLIDIVSLPLKIHLSLLTACYTLTLFCGEIYCINIVLQYPIH